MEELLKFVEKEITKLRNTKLSTMDEDGEEIECYDVESIYNDGRISGKLSAYVEIRDKLLKIKEYTW